MIKLNKGGRINLSKSEPGLKKASVGLGWDLSRHSNQFDLDVSVFMLGENGKTPADEFFIFYNNLISPDKSVEHTGDNRTGDGHGDDEIINIDLSKIHEDISELLFVVTIHDATFRKQNFGQVANAYIRIYDQETNRVIAKYELDEDFSYETGVIFGSLYKKSNEWRFMATGQGYESGLQGFVDRYV